MTNKTDSKRGEDGEDQIKLIKTMDSSRQGAKAPRTTYENIQDPDLSYFTYSSSTYGLCSPRKELLELDRSPLR